MRRPFPKRRPGAMETRVSELVLAISGVLLLAAITLLLLSWLNGDAEGFVAGYLPARNS
ncbi:hypothetical protein [Methylobacterium sp. R2-1]|uniref:hypothetical protein n=1 Tax=Methylobacterium sp. R2-1 TaxID=2587064 RepID=UPI0016132A75|nr:hypothetical protein [Methylobacterium sp. R2-1]MBB2965209.1 hypothetical protein [Methylobacterium sp. R2-1]